MGGPRPAAGRACGDRTRPNWTKPCQPAASGGASLNAVAFARKIDPALTQSAQLAGANLAGADLTGLDITSADLTGTQLADATLWTITSLAFSPRRHPPRHWKL